MRKTLEAASFTGKDLNDIITSVLPTLLPKTMVAKVGSKISKELLFKLKNQPKAKVIRISEYTKALDAYKNNLRLAGYTGKGRPTTSQIFSSVSMNTSQELRVLETGRSRKWRNELPAEFSIGNTVKPF